MKRCPDETDCGDGESPGPNCELAGVEGDSERRSLRAKLTVGWVGGA